MCFTLNSRTSLLIVNKSVLKVASLLVTQMSINHSKVTNAQNFEAEGRYSYLIYGSEIVYGNKS